MPSKIYGQTVQLNTTSGQSYTVLTITGKGEIINITGIGFTGYSDGTAIQAYTFQVDGGAYYDYLGTTDLRPVSSAYVKGIKFNSSFKILLRSRYTAQAEINVSYTIET
jgi:hypothetical protein